MKRKFLITGRFVRILPFLLACLLVLSACKPIEKEGITNYDPATCSVGLTANLFPSGDFLTIYPYQSGDYHYLDTEDLVWGYAKAFARLSYDPETYAEVKTYCLENFNLSRSQSRTVNGYTFSEHICYKSKDASGTWQLDSHFPKQFNMFGYHDESCTLVFLGYYNGDPESEESALAQTDFSSFLSTVYAEFYDFNR